MGYVNIKANRLKLGKSCAKMAKSLKISERSYYSKEAGERPFTGPELLKLARIFKKYNIEYLMKWEE